MPKKVLIAMPPSMLEKVDSLAYNEHRTRSDLIREALRRYIQAAELEEKMNFTPHPGVTLTTAVQ